MLWMAVVDESSVDDLMFHQLPINMFRRRFEDVSEIQLGDLIIFAGLKVIYYHPVTLHSNNIHSIVDNNDFNMFYLLIML